MALAVGTRLGPYEIVAPLGAGGMGEVYRAKDTRLGREVAIKVLPAHLTTHPEVRARFEREAKTVSSLNHSHICTLFDVGRQGETDYLVMELIEGETLASRLARGMLSLSDVLRLGAEIADALDKAHRAGIVHRDLKPGNVMLTKSGSKLMDFGLARAAGVGGPKSSGVSIAGLTQSPTLAQPLTAEGTLVGTFQYLSPEQLEGREADSRSDIWALGCVLFEMATGKCAFAGSSQAALISAIMSTQPAPISQLSPVAPPAFDRLVRNCLAKDSADRIQSAHDVKLQLDGILEAGAQSPGAAAASRPTYIRGRGLLALAVLALIAAALSGAWAWRERTARRSMPAHLTLSLPADASLRSMREPEISPDGKSLVFVGRDGDGNAQLYRRAIDRDEAIPIEGSAGASGPFWSPDGLHVGFFADGKLERVAAVGGPPRVLCDAARGVGATWGSRGVIVFSGGEGEPLFAVPEEGGMPRAVTQLGPLDEGHRWPAFLPDGEHFLYLADARRSEDHWLRAASLDGDVDVPFMQHAITNLRFVAPNWLFYARGGSLLAQRFNVKRLQLQGEAIPIANQVRVGLYHQYEFSCSASGVVVYCSANPLQELVWYSRAGERLGAVGKPERFAEVSLSPDERRLAYATEDSDGRHDQLYLLDLERGIVSRPTAGAGNYANPVWSPDGESLAFAGTATGTGCLYLSPLAGTARDEVLHSSSIDCSPTDWSSDGRWLLFYDINDSLPGLYLRDMGSSEAAIVAAIPLRAVVEARFSADGQWLVHGQSSPTGDEDEIFVQDFPAAQHRYQISTGGGFSPHWGADGREIIFRNRDDEILAAAIRTAGGFVSEAPRKLFHVPGGQLAAVSSDGQRLMLRVPLQDPATAQVHVLLDWQRIVAAK